MKVKVLYDRPVSKNITPGNSNIACAFAQTTVMSNGDIVCLYRILVMQSSSDFGYTWSESQTIFEGLELQPPQSVLSHSICTTQTGALLVTFFLIEAAKPDLYVFSDEGFRLKRKIYAIRSKDEGETWSACEPVGMLGGLTVPLALTHGIVLGLSQFRQPPEGLRLWVSRDNGVTWDTEDSIQMWDAGQNRVLGMSVTQLLRKNKETDIWSDLKDWTFGTQDLVLLDDGTIMMTYYATLENIIHIRACRFRVGI